jgi:hypothetical protein
MPKHFPSIPNPNDISTDFAYQVGESLIGKTAEEIEDYIEKLYMFCERFSDMPIFADRLLNVVIRMLVGYMHQLEHDCELRANRFMATMPGNPIRQVLYLLFNFDFKRISLLKSKSNLSVPVVESAVNTLEALEIIAVSDDYIEFTEDGWKFALECFSY